MHGHAGRRRGGASWSGSGCSAGGAAALRSPESGGHALSMCGACVVPAWCLCVACVVPVCCLRVACVVPVCCLCVACVMPVCCLCVAYVMPV